MASYPTPPGAPVVIQKFYDTEDDLIYNILLALGGTMADVKQIFHDTTDDLLYAVLQRIDGAVTIDPGDGGFNAAGFVGTLSLTSPIAQVLKFGTTAGGNEIAEDIVITPDEWTDLTLNITSDPGTIFYVTGNDDLTIKIRR